MSRAWRENDAVLWIVDCEAVRSRIVNQAAVLSVIADPRLQMEEWLAEHPDTFRALGISAELKREMRRRLDHTYITERLVTPGLDRLTRWLKRYCSPHWTADEEQRGSQMERR